MAINSADKGSSRLQAAWRRKISRVKIDWLKLGTDVRLERERRGLSLEQFSALTGVNLATSALVEGGAGQSCSAEVFLTLTRTISRNPLVYAEG